MSDVEATKAEQSARRRAYYLANRERILAGQKLRQEQNREELKAYQKAWYQANKDREQAKRRDYREANKESEAKRGKAWYQANKQRAASTRRAYYEANKEAIDAWKAAYALRRKYGITPEERALIIKEQRGRCPGCKTRFGTVKGTEPHVDHCHSTGRVRGVLCGHCNKAVGLAADSPRILRALATYLEGQRQRP